MICEQYNRVDIKHTSEIETAPALLVLNSNTETKQSENIKSESIPDALKYLGILAKCYFSSLFVCSLYEDCYGNNL